MEARAENRNKVIIRFNIAGIIMNLLLSAAKLIIGMKIGSRAVMLDAVNGFSDMFTSVLSILSTLWGGNGRIGRILLDTDDWNTSRPCSGAYL